MILVSGKLYVVPGKRDEFLKSSKKAMAQARIAPGCRDFVVAADPLEEDRINIYEEWDSEIELESFRGSGPSEKLTELIIRAEVDQREVPDESS